MTNRLVEQARLALALFQYQSLNQFVDLSPSDRKRSQRLGVDGVRNKLKSESTREKLRGVYFNCKAQGITSPPDHEMEELMSNLGLTKFEIQTFLGGMRFREKKRRIEK